MRYIIYVFHLYIIITPEMYIVYKYYIYLKYQYEHSHDESFKNSKAFSNWHRSYIYIIADLDKSVYKGSN